jgi:hypothetical protein
LPSRGWGPEIQLRHVAEVPVGNVETEQQLPRGTVAERERSAEVPLPCAVGRRISHRDLRSCVQRNAGAGPIHEAPPDLHGRVAGRRAIVRHAGSVATTHHPTSHPAAPHISARPTPLGIIPAPDPASREVFWTNTGSPPEESAVRCIGNPGRNRQTGRACGEDVVARGE